MSIAYFNSSTSSAPLAACSTHVVKAPDGSGGSRAFLSPSHSLLLPRATCCPSIRTQAGLAHPGSPCSLDDLGCPQALLPYTSAASLGTKQGVVMVTVSALEAGRPPFRSSVLLRKVQLWRNTCLGQSPRFSPCSRTPGQVLPGETRRRKGIRVEKGEAKQECDFR